MAAPSPPMVISKSAINPLPLHGGRLDTIGGARTQLDLLHMGECNIFLEVISTLAKPFAVRKDQVIDTFTHDRFEVHGIFTT